ncbi:MAG TPA: hypothetical protein VGM16_10260 [Gammaproteobacteria bacterium]
MGLQSVITIITAAVFAGAIAWALLWLGLRAAGLLRFKGAFPELVQNVPGGAARRQLRLMEREVATLMAALSAAVGAALSLAFYAEARLSGVWMWVLFGLGCALAIGWIVVLVRHLRRWRDLRFAARAQAAFAGTLGRLNLQAHRVFHDVEVAGITLDHVVLGTKGCFAVHLVARRPRKGAETVVRINGRSIEFQDGYALLDTIALAERGARALADLPVKGLSHRLHVLPVVAVPGWEIAPSQGQAGETFLANEKTAMLLLRVSKPADYLMDADAALLHEHLSHMAVDTAL